MFQLAFLAILQLCNLGAQCPIFLLLKFCEVIRKGTDWWVAQQGTGTSSQWRHATEARLIGRTKFVMKVVRGRVGLAQVIVLLVENLHLCNQLLQEE